jgi:hypothetical protein
VKGVSTANNPLKSTLQLVVVAVCQLASELNGVIVAANPLWAFASASAAARTLNRSISLIYLYSFEIYGVDSVTPTRSGSERACTCSY